VAPGVLVERLTADVAEMSSGLAVPRPPLLVTLDMPQLLPFAGLRPDPAVTGPLDDVVCPPYDVISEHERLALLERSPFNLVRVELPEGRYGDAARLLQQWVATGALRREAAPALYGYRMTYKAPDGKQRCTLGVLGALVLEPPGQGILPHEHTTPKAKSDRLELLRATRANISPIWCLCPEPGLAAALDPSHLGAGPALAASRPADVLPAPLASPTARAMAATPASARDDDGVLHEIWPIFDPATHRRVNQLAQAGPLLVADGHHRYEVALAYQAEARSSHGPTSQQRPASQQGPASHQGPPAGADQVLALVVELVEGQLQVLPIHRLVSGLPAGFDTLAALSRHFELRPATTPGTRLPAEMARQGALGILAPGGAWLAFPRLLPEPAAPGGLRADLDSARADRARSDWPPHQVSYEPSLEAITEAISSGRSQLALLCRPATVSQIAATAQGGGRMPPKTTYFWPKPRTGMVLRDFSA